MPELSLQGKLTQDPFTFIQVFIKKQCMETVVVGKKWEQPWVFIDERVLMRIWETKCHVWIDTETNRVRTLYKHTFQRDAHANTHWSTEENLLFPSLLHFPFFISPSLHPPSLHMCETCCRGNGLQRCVFIRGGEASFSLSFASRLLKQNKASRRKRTWEWKKWKLIIFLHILPFISLYMYLSVLISFCLRSWPASVSRTLIISTRMKVKVSYTQRHVREHTPATRLITFSKEIQTLLHKD